MKFSLNKSFTLGDLVSVAVPLLTLVVVFVTLREDVDRLRFDDKRIEKQQEELAIFNQQIGKILTGHTTSLAVLNQDVQNLDDTDTEIKSFLLRMEHKLDDLQKSLRKVD